MLSVHRFDDWMALVDVVAVAEWHVLLAWGRVPIEKDVLED